MTPTVSRLLFTSTVALALASAPNPAFAKHHGGGSHSGGHSLGGAGGGFHGGGRSHSGGAGGFHFGGGHSSGKGFRSGHSAVPRQTGGGSSGRFGGLPARANSYSAFFGGRAAGSNGSRNINAAAGRTIGSSFFRASAAGTRAPVMNLGMNFGSNRPPSSASPARSWPGQGQSSWANTPRSPSSFNPNRPPSATSPSRSRSGQNQSSWASLSRSTVSFNPNRGLSNSGNSRFGNSAFGHSSSSHSRSGARSGRYGGSRFGGGQQSDWGSNSFQQGVSSGADDFSFIPDLFGLALDLGGFGLRGLTLLGPGLSLGVTGLDLLTSGLDNFNPDASLDSRQWGSGPILDPDGNCNCPQ
jgi:hypothetical protein